MDHYGFYHGNLKLGILLWTNKTLVWQVVSQKICGFPVQLILRDPHGCWAQVQSQWEYAYQGLSRPIIITYHGLLINEL